MDRCGRTAHEPNVLGSHPYRIARSALAQAPPQTDEVYNPAPTYTPPKTINITAHNAERTAALFRDRALSRQPSSRCRKCVRSLCEPLSLCDAAQCGRFFWPAIANLAHCIVFHGASTIDRPSPCFVLRSISSSFFTLTRDIVKSCGSEEHG
jgi:hypothetical protein